MINNVSVYIMPNDCFDLLSKCPVHQQQRKFLMAAHKEIVKDGEQIISTFPTPEPLQPLPSTSDDAPHESDTVEDPVEDTVEDPVEDTVDNPIEDTVDDPVEDTVDPVVESQ